MKRRHDRATLRSRRRWGRAPAPLALAVLVFAGVAASVAVGVSPGVSPAAAAQSPAAAPVKLTKVGTFNRPVGVIFHPVTRVRYVLEQRRGLRRLDGNRALALDLAGQLSTGNEQGFLGAAFSNDGATLYVNITVRSGDTEIRGYAFRKGVAAAAPRLLLGVDQPYSNHNGGQLVMGSDGVLWVGLGDGGAGGDPQDNAQNPDSLLGKILRLSPSVLAGKGTAEVWAQGLRNPWRFSIDEPSGLVFIGDVGQNAVEEIDRVGVSDGPGLDFGWRRREGTRPFRGGERRGGDLEPIYEYLHDDGGCSVTGGFVYRGRARPDLVGTYVFGDYCQGRLLSIPSATDPSTEVSVRPLGPRVSALSSFGVDADGELYVCSLDGPVYRVR